MTDEHDDWDRLLEMLQEDRPPAPAMLRAGRRYQEMVEQLPSLAELRQFEHDSRKRTIRVQ